jgi:hypothetical protein
MDHDDWLRWTLHHPLEIVFDTGLASFFHFVWYKHLLLPQHLLRFGLLHLMHLIPKIDQRMDILELLRFMFLAEVLLTVDFKVLELVIIIHVGVVTSFKGRQVGMPIHMEFLYLVLDRPVIWCTPPLVLGMFGTSESMLEQE